MITLCAIYKTHFKYKDIYGLQVNGWEKISHARGNKIRVWGHSTVIRHKRL